LSVILMATLAIPLHMESRAEGLGGRVAPYLPALTLTAAAFVEVVSPGQRAVTGDWMTPTRFLVAVCAGLGARALGQALRVMVAGSSLALWSGSVAYGVLTLVSGSIGLVSLWQRGVLWTGSHAVMSGGIAAAWLAWSASWLTPSRYPRVRAGLTAMAALQLISAAIK
jgi:hypothetical protein